jgi:hypothetical protein
VSPVRYELGFYIPEDDMLHSDCREHLKSYFVVVVSIFSVLPVVVSFIVVFCVLCSCLDVWLVRVMRVTCLLYCCTTATGLNPNCSCIYTGEMRPMSACVAAPSHPSAQFVCSELALLLQGPATARARLCSRRPTAADVTPCVPSHYRGISVNCKWICSPRLGRGRLLQFRNPIDRLWDSYDGGSAPRNAAHAHRKHRHRIHAQRH